MLRRKLDEQKQAAEKGKLKDATALLKKLEKETKELALQAGSRKGDGHAQRPCPADRRSGGRQLGGAEKIKQDLHQLDKIDRGPADKLAQALQRGDFQKAADEMQKLKEQLAGKELDDAGKQKLADQLQQMEEKLNQMADAAKAAQADLQRNSTRRGRTVKRTRPTSWRSNSTSCSNRPRKCSRCNSWRRSWRNAPSACGKGGQAGQAAKAMGQLQAGLDQVQKQLDELETLDGAMEQLADARQGMSCPKCGGAGCKQCQGQGFCPGQGIGKNGQNGLKPGIGMGPGRGQGARPEAKDNTAMYDSRVRQQVGPGPGTVIGEAPGPNVKGQVEAELQQQFDTARHGYTDPLSGRRLPRKHSEQAEEYFDRLREGK